MVRVGEGVVVRRATAGNAADGYRSVVRELPLPRFSAELRLAPAEKAGRLCRALQPVVVRLVDADGHAQLLRLAFFRADWFCGVCGRRVADSAHRAAH